MSSHTPTRLPSIPYHILSPPSFNPFIHLRTGKAAAIRNSRYKLMHTFDNKWSGAWYIADEDYEFDDDFTQYGNTFLCVDMLSHTFMSSCIPFHSLIYSLTYPLTHPLKSISLTHLLLPLSFPHLFRWMFHHHSYLQWHLHPLPV